MWAGVIVVVLVVIVLGETVAMFLGVGGAIVRKARGGTWQR